MTNTARETIADIVWRNTDCKSHQAMGAAKDILAALPEILRQNPENIAGEALSNYRALKETSDD